MISTLAALLYIVCLARATFWQLRADANLYATTRWFYWHLGGMLFSGVVASYSLHYALTLEHPIVWFGFFLAVGVLGYMYKILYVIMDKMEALDGNPVV